MLESSWAGGTPLDLANQPLPKRQRLGVGIVDAKSPHAFAGPEQDRVAQFGPQSFSVRVVEIDIDDVFVFLGRILGVFDRSVGPETKPLRMLAHPRMVGRGLNCEIERHLNPELRGGTDESAEVGKGAELGGNCPVTAFF